MEKFTVKFKSEDQTYFENVKTSEYHTDADAMLKISESEEPELSPKLSINKNKPKFFDVTCECNHKPSKETAKIYNDFVNNEKKHMMHSRGGDNPPNSMYLNFELAFTLNGTNYTACVGMNSDGLYNRWNFCSPYLLADSSEKSGYLNDSSKSSTTYEIKPSGSNTFKISEYY